MGSEVSTPALTGDHVEFVNDTPDFWYCQAIYSLTWDQRDMVASARSDLCNAISSANPWPEVEGQLDEIASATLTKKGYKKVPTSGKSEQSAATFPSWAACFTANFANSSTNMVHVRSLEIIPELNELTYRDSDASRITYSLGQWTGRKDALTIKTVTAAQPAWPEAQ